MNKRLIFGLFTLLTLVFVSTSSVYAQSQRKLGTPVSREAGELNRTRVEEQNRDGKLKSCQTRLETVTKRSTHMVELAENMFVKFGAISTRTQEFYINKGLVVDNYNDLLADIAVKKAAVETALDATSTIAENFNCDNDPKAQMTEYKENMQKVVVALKEYKKSVRNLIVAVHSKSK